MATSALTNTIKDPSGTAVSGAVIVATLRPGPGFRTADGSEISEREQTITDGTGSWSLTLERNEDVYPAGSYWSIEEHVPDAFGGARTWKASVGTVAANLRASLLAELPPGPAPEQYLTEAIGDARYETPVGATAKVTDHNDDAGAHAGLTGTFVPLTQAQVGGTAKRIFTITPDSAGAGPWVLDTDQTTWTGVQNPTAAFGYNMNAQGQRVTAGEDAFAMMWEANYNDGSGQNKMEFYLQHLSDDGLTTKRPLFVAVNRTTNAITAFAITAPLFSLLQDDGASTVAVQMSTTGATFFGLAGNSTKVELRAGTGGGSSFEMGYNAVNRAGVLIAQGVNVSSFYTGGATQTLVASFFDNGVGGTGFPGICIGTTFTNEATGYFKVAHGAMFGHVIKGGGGQSANLWELRDSSDVVLSTFSENGYFTTRKSAAPADAELAAGEMSLWFDKTNGASKLMVKAKQADGTVKTAAVALA